MQLVTRSLSSKSIKRASLTRPAGTARAVMEWLEERRLFAITTTPIAPVTVTAGQTPAPIDLTNAFDDPAVPSKVTLNTNVTTNGVPDTIVLDLLDAQKPVTVKNFVNYVRSGSYNNTIIHRSASLTADALTAPVEILQGGGYAAPTALTVGQNLPHISTSAPIVNEGTTNGVVSNTAGTIAMARTSDPNSATSEWFINVTDNTELDPSQFNAGYAVFGTVDPASGTAVADLAALKRYDFGDQTPFPTLPLQNTYTGSQTAPTTPATAADLVTITSATVDPKFTFSATSSDPSLLTAAVDSNGRLVLTPVSQTPGTATVTVTATELANPQNVSTQSVTVTTAAPGTQVVLSSTGNRSVTFTPTGGKKTTLTLRGPGTATLTLSGPNTVSDATPKNHRVVATGNVDSVSIALTGSTAKTSLTAAGARFTLSNLTTNGPLGTVSGPIDLTGTLSVNGAVTRLSLGGLQGSVAAASFGNLTVSGAVSNATVSTSGGALTTFKSGSFAGSTVTASSLGSVNLGVITPANGGRPFGLTASTIRLVRGRIGTKNLVLVNPKSTNLDAQLTRRGLSSTQLADFHVTLV